MATTYWTLTCASLNSWQFIDTPEFNRLRKVSQTATVQFVYPSATHTRFEHSVGTAILAENIFNRLTANKLFFENEEEEDTICKCVSLAGLLHDLGHGPFSHLFDNEVIPLLMCKFNKTWLYLETRRRLCSYA